MDTVKKHSYDLMEQSNLTDWAKWNFSRIPYKLLDGQVTKLKNLKYMKEGSFEGDPKAG